MKSLIIGGILIMVSIANFSNSQINSEYNPTKKDELNNEVIDQLKVIYGESFKNHILDNPSKLEFYIKFYERCQFIPERKAPSGIKNISTLYLKDKYNLSKIKHEYIKTFKETDFIVLKDRKSTRLNSSPVRISYAVF